MLMAQRFASTRATSTPGAKRRKSGMLVAPERRMSSCVITKIAAPVFDNFCSFFETEVTWMFIRSSRLTVERSGSWGACAQPKRPVSAITRARRHGNPLPMILKQFLVLEVRAHIFLASGRVYTPTLAWLIGQCESTFGYFAPARKFVARGVPKG